jgi:hypothetical protein
MKLDMGPVHGLNSSTFMIENNGGGVHIHVQIAIMTVGTVLVPTLLPSSVTYFEHGPGRRWAAYSPRG